MKNLKLAGTMALIATIFLTVTKSLMAQSDQSLENLEKKRAEIVEQMQKIPKEVEDTRRQEVLAGGNPDKVYFYSVEVTNASANDFDSVSGIVAGFVQQIGLGNACVDLRATGSFFHGVVLEHGTVGIVLQTTIPEEKFQDLQSAVCRGRANCKTTITSRAVSLSEISVANYGFAPHDHKVHPEVMKTFKIKADSRLPMFSNACVSGKYQDSWNDAASTPKSRKYMVDLGLDISQARTLGLLDANNEELWTFGFPSQSRNATGTTK